LTWEVRASCPCTIWNTSCSPAPRARCALVLVRQSIETLNPLCMLPVNTRRDGRLVCADTVLSSMVNEVTRSFVPLALKLDCRKMATTTVGSSRRQEQCGKHSRFVPNARQKIRQARDEKVELRAYHPRWPARFKQEAGSIGVLLRQKNPWASFGSGSLLST